MVTLQVQGVGAFRGVASAIAEMIATYDPTKPDCPDLYVTDGCGRVWAPARDEWILWENIPAPEMGFAPLKSESAKALSRYCVAKIGVKYGIYDNQTKQIITKSLGDAMSKSAARQLAKELNEKE
jgi:hypothetical protein